MQDIANFDALDQITTNRTNHMQDIAIASCDSTQYHNNQHIYLQCTYLCINRNFSKGSEKSKYCIVRPMENMHKQIDQKELERTSSDSNHMNEYDKPIRGVVARS